MAKVKICGITNLEDALLAVELGADMLGFNFYEKSPRFIETVAARKIISALPESLERIGVFVNMEQQPISEHVGLLDLDAVQLHGDETDDFITDLRSKVKAKIIKAFRVGTGFQIKSISESAVDSILLDAYSKDQYGGTGKRFEWSVAADAARSIPELILAGGLTSENVAEAIGIVKPYAVDVASGVESAPGKKDPAKMEAFIRNAKNA